MLENALRLAHEAAAPQPVERQARPPLTRSSFAPIAASCALGLFASGCQPTLWKSSERAERFAADEPCTSAPLYAKLKALGARWGEGVTVYAIARRPISVHVRILLRGRVMWEGDKDFTPAPASPATTSTTSTPPAPPPPLAPACSAPTTVDVTPAGTYRLTSRGASTSAYDISYSYSSSWITVLGTFGFEVDPTLGFAEGRDERGNAVWKAPLPYGAPWTIEVASRTAADWNDVEFYVEQWDWAPNSTNEKYLEFVKKRASAP